MNKIKKQEGAVLIVVLILFIIFLIAAVGMVKSSLVMVSSTTNYAFRQNAATVADSIVTTVKAKIFGGTDRTTGTTYTALDLTANTANLYSAVLLNDTRGVSGSGDGVPANPCGGTLGWSCVPTDSTTYPSYGVQYFVERMCNATGAIGNTAASCQVVKPTIANGGAQSNRGGNQQGNSFNTYPILYRVTIKVSGPANTSVMTQVYLSK